MFLCVIRLFFDIVMVLATNKYVFLVFKMVMSPSVGNKEIKQDTSSSGAIIDGIDR